MGIGHIVAQRTRAHKMVHQARVADKGIAGVLQGNLGPTKAAFDARVISRVA